MIMPEFAGKLRERIRIERQLPARDTLGGASAVRQLVGEFWAAGEAAETGDEEQAESRVSLQRWRFTMRLTDGILPGDELIWNEVSMRIRTISKEFRPVPKSIILAEERR